MKEGCLFVLFCFVLFCFAFTNEIHRNRDVLDHILGLFGKLLKRSGASVQFHGVWTCGAKILEY
jgi:hypothetical protein